jgi:hypothetical protein
MLAIAILWLLVGLVASFVLGAMLEQLGATAQLVGGLAAAIGVPIVGSILTVRMLRVRVPG